MGQQCGNVQLSCPHLWRCEMNFSLSGGYSKIPSFLLGKNNISASWLMCQGRMFGPYHILALKRILFPLSFFFLSFFSPRSEGVYGNLKGVFSMLSLQCPHSVSQGLSVVPTPYWILVLVLETYTIIAALSPGSILAVKAAHRAPDRRSRNK